ncbi:adenylate/guanylate cyclase domain-containing protein [Mycolicibacterium cosmeticum]|uniref:adenylate/guanylate cyclase domain-containing protein n=1 Tax=Mycolicibacterium cosmeticum TaxID=258533 RepID=UPI003204E6F2
MDRIWQRVWDRYGGSYIRVLWLAAFLISLPVYSTFVSFPIVVHEKSSRYVEVAGFTVVAVAVLVCSMVLPYRRWARPVEQFAAGGEVDRRAALEGTYIWARKAVPRVVWGTGVWAALLASGVGGIAGAPWWRLVQYGIVGAFVGTTVQLIAYHSIAEAVLRPPRVALAGDSGIGDSLPRSRPTFATRSNRSVVAVALAFAIGGAMLTSALRPPPELPIFWIVIGCAITLTFAVPISVGIGFSSSLRPIRDLAEGAERVAEGDYTQRLPVVQDDDLGALAATFNRMQAGLAERQRLQAAFGTYVDPVLAARLLKQPDDVFSGERRKVTVMFVDVRDFTPFAEANTAEHAVARLNTLFEIVVPAVLDAGGHVNKFLGDGALAVFGAPNDLADHADAALNAAVLIQRLVAERFNGELQIGIGINTGVVIAGTIGGGNHLEYTLIGDTTNVAARVEQLTKTTGDTILLTEQTLEGLTANPPGLADRGTHVLKGKSAATRIFAIHLRSSASEETKAD